MLRPTALISLQLLTWFSFQCLADGGLITRPQSAQVPSTEVLEQEMEYLNSSAPFLKSFERTVHKLPPAEQQQIEASILEKAEEQMAEESKEAEGCVTDFSAPCPRSWVPRSDRETSSQYCDAPKDYKGYCETSKSFEFYSESAKADWAKDCQAEWPCKGDELHSCPSGSRDYSWPCPEGFGLRPDGETCEAALGNYSGMCPLVANFSGFSEAAKRSWSDACGAYWPCTQDCVAGYEAICPEGWAHEGSFWCTAPAPYTAKGPCEGRWNFKYFTKEMKRSFEHSCQAHFPCENTCEKEYADPCPKGWDKRDNTCHAPEGQAPCGVNRVSFALATLSEKKRFESECNVSWPCKATDTCEINWSFPCPVGWNVLPPIGKSLSMMTTESERGSNWLEAACEPPGSTTTACEKREAFQSEAEKRKWASMCELTWPCVETEKEKAYTAITAKRMPWTVFGPRPPTPVTDRRELGKHGPVHHDTGEVWPRHPRKILPFSRIVGIEHKRVAPAAPSIVEALATAVSERKGEMRPAEKEYAAHRGYYGGLAVGFHLLGSST